MKYQVVTGKRKQYLYAEFNNKNEAVEYLLKLQLQGKRNMRVVKCIPYATGMHEQVTVF